MTTNEFLNEVISNLKKSDNIEIINITPSMEHIFSSAIIQVEFKNGTTHEYRLSITNYNSVQDKYLK